MFSLKFIVKDSSYRIISVATNSANSSNNNKEVYPVY